MFVSSFTSMKKIFLLISILKITSLLGQNGSFFNHYGLTSTYYNPSAVSMESDAIMDAIFRSQWVGYQATIDPGGPPSTQLISLTIPTEFSRISGVGFSVVNDRVADFNSIDARFQIASKFYLGNRQLHIGIAPGITNRQLGGSFRPVDNQDNLIPDENISQLMPNLHFGLTLENNQGWVFGASIENILQPSFDFGADGQNTLISSYNFWSIELLK